MTPERIAQLRRSGDLYSLSPQGVVAANRTISECLDEIERLQADLAKHQTSEFHPDWSLLQATQKSLREAWQTIARLQGDKERNVALTLRASGDGDVVLLCSRDGRYVYAVIHVDALQGLESLGDGEYSCDWWRRNLPLDVVLTLEGDSDVL